MNNLLSFFKRKRQDTPTVTPETLQAIESLVDSDRPIIIINNLTINNKISNTSNNVSGGGAKQINR